jgi:hypothetical protein
MRFIRVVVVLVVAGLGTLWLYDWLEERGRSGPVEEPVPTRQGSAPGISVPAPRLVSDYFEEMDVGGRVYREVTVRKVYPDSIGVTHAEGAGTLPLDRAPEGVRKKYGYDPEAARAHRELVGRARSSGGALEAGGSSLARLFDGILAWFQSLFHAQETGPANEAAPAGVSYQAPSTEPPPAAPTPAAAHAGAQPRPGLDPGFVHNRREMIRYYEKLVSESSKSTAKAQIAKYREKIAELKAEIGE